jgi:peptidoglycan/LPS O-acetylase OafA/YrhL
VRLGNASYAVYIVHYSVITLLATLLVHKLHLAVSDPLCLGCAFVGLCCGLAFDRLVDQPIQRSLLRWRDRIPKARHGTAMEPREAKLNVDRSSIVS